MLTAALLTLTVTLSGDIRLTLSEMDSRTSCEASRTGVTTILAEAGVEVIAALCGETDLRLTPFQHGAGPDEETHLYRVETDGTSGFDIHPIETASECSAGTKGGRQVFCARSSQSVLP